MQKRFSVGQEPGTLPFIVYLKSVPNWYLIPGVKYSVVTLKNTIIKLVFFNLIF